MMMKRTFLTALLLLTPIFSHAQDYALTPENTSIVFEMDSTWHKFSGSAPDLQGTLSVDNLASPRIVQGKVVIFAEKMTTEDEKRDEKMHDLSLESVKFPEIVYEITGLEEEKLQGNLTVRETTRPVELSLVKSTQEGAITYVGTTVIQWKDYDVKDPSIFIATVFDDVVISVKVTLPLEGN